nr:immunoglobulin heavy chain junction region [Macaca mulatta]MOX61640.1 immunoglobulin heavy chain junction region [Macaca mulatta]MOX62698.1 immunoglobulin heavy chain junction region [Macaca mulatta]MOX63263.1 immunoglobulin heavy chain junction region [Macaca mulatta]MOX66397.1 immunoglobulin heavy chain junction region [Macaca mulatta]
CARDAYGRGFDSW